MDPKNKPIKVGILTISDTRTPSISNIETFDSSGHELKELIDKSNIIESATVVEYNCVRDDVEKIQETMLEWCLANKVDVILSTGGTGFSPRDVTPEATLGIVEKLTPGITQAILFESLKFTPMAMLSRGVSGIYGKTLIVNLPGSKKAARQCLSVIASIIPHAVSLIKDEKEISEQFHNQLSSRNNVSLIKDKETILELPLNQSNIKDDEMEISNTYSHESNIRNDLPKVPECVLKVACRHRESPFPKISMESALDILIKHALIQKKHKMNPATVWIYSTGDELYNFDGIHSGYIRDSNSLMIKQIIEEDKYPGHVYIGDIIKDNWDDVCKHFEKGFDRADIIITTGGVSMGEKDLIKHVLKEHFKCNIHFGRVDMKPGMPTTFATFSFKDENKSIFCLPGNPVSAGVCTHLFVLPYLRSIVGRKSIVHSFKAKLKHSIDKLDERPEYKRALLEYKNRRFNVSSLTNNQQSSKLLSFRGANCLLALPSSTKQKKVEAGTIMNVILIKSIVNTYDAPILSFNRILQVKSMTDSEIPTINVTLKHAWNYMADQMPISNRKIFPIESAMGYVILEPVYSLENLPPFPAAIKDGYAIHSSSWSQSTNIFEVVLISVAGILPNSQEINTRNCARISTGAPIPSGANCVVPVEDTTVVSKSTDGTVEFSICILKEPKPLDNIRLIGSDIHAGECLVDRHCQLGPFEIALLRSVGCKEVTVYNYPTIHLIQITDDFSCRISSMLGDILKFDGYKGKILCHALCKRLFESLIDQFNNPKENFKQDDILIICCDTNSFESYFTKVFNVEMRTYLKNSKLNISLGFGILCLKNKKIAFFHITNENIDLAYNSMHLLILPFLRIVVGKKQQVSLIKTKPLSLREFYLPTNLFLKAKLKMDENGDFGISSFGWNVKNNCIVSLPSTYCEDMEESELDVIVTENSDSYFINY